MLDLKIHITENGKEIYVGSYHNYGAGIQALLYLTLLVSIVVGALIFPKDPNGSNDGYLGALFIMSLFPLGAVALIAALIEHKHGQLFIDAKDIKDKRIFYKSERPFRSVRHHMRLFFADKTIYMSNKNFEKFQEVLEGHKFKFEKQQ